MKKVWIILIITLAVLGSYTFLNKNKSTNNQITRPSPTDIAELASENKSGTDLLAYFEIYTNGTKRIFTDARYRNNSADVYIENPGSPNEIRVKKEGITWSDFFGTLPMKLTRDCLVTGTNQSFCSGEQGSLKFYLNSKEDMDALEKIILQGDILKVEFKK